MSYFNVEKLLEDINLNIPRLRTGSLYMKHQRPLDELSLEQRIKNNDILRREDPSLIEDQIWNKYCGKKVVAIRARQGGGNREYYMPEVYKHPRYLEDCDEGFDFTYNWIYIDVSDIDMSKYFEKE